MKKLVVAFMAGMATTALLPTITAAEPKPATYTTKAAVYSRSFSPDTGDTTTFIAPTGDLFTYDIYLEGDAAHLLMSDNGTPEDIKDDIILDVLY